MKLANVEDLTSLAVACGGYLATAIVPARLDDRLVPRLLESGVVVRQRWVRRIERTMRVVLGPVLPEANYSRLATEFCRMFRENQWLRWRALHRAGVPVTTEVKGIGRLEAALEDGRGVIFWGMSFCDSLVVKIGLHRAGVAVRHLSAAYHGASWPPTRLGLRVVAPIYSVAESRFLAERVIVPADGSLGYIRTLMDRLSANGCVYIAGERLAVRQNVAVTLLGRRARFATGAAGLSWKLGARLLPVHVVRDAPLRYSIVIGDAIEPDRASKHDFITMAVQQFAGRVERCILEHPADWAWYGHPVREWLSEPSLSADSTHGAAGATRPEHAV